MLGSGLEGMGVEGSGGDKPNGREGRPREWREGGEGGDTGERARQYISLFKSRNKSLKKFGFCSCPGVGV